MSLWCDSGVNHDIVDDEDDHRVLVARCGERCYYVPPARRETHPFAPNMVTCLLCILTTYEYDVWGW